MNGHGHVGHGHSGAAAPAGLFCFEKMQNFTRAAMTYQSSGTPLGIGLAFFFFFWLFRAAPMASGSSHARAPIRAAAASRHHSHSNTRFEPCLQRIPQLRATPDLQSTEQGQGSTLHPHED